MPSMLKKGIVDLEEPRKKRVLIEGPFPPPWGGIAYLMAGLFDSKLQDSYDLMLYRTGHIGSFSGLLAHTIRELGLLLKLPIVIKRHHIDLVHMNSSSWTGFWRYSFHLHLAKLCGVPVMFHLHGGEFKKFYDGLHPITRWYVRKTYSRMDGIVALTIEWKEFLSTITDQEKVFVIPNAIDIDQYVISEPERLIFKKSMGIPEEASLFLYIGPFIQGKGINEIIKAFEDIFQMEKTELIESQICLLFIGNKGDLTGIVKEFCDRYPDNCWFMGHVGQKKKYKALGSADVLILPTYAEGQPIVILEAMAAECAIITTPVGGIPSTIREGDNCFYVKPGNATDLKEKVIKLHMDRELRHRMGLKNRSLAIEKYSWRVVEDKFKQAYQTVLGGN